ncbi:sensor histidine kinase [Pseudonocardiaceae bacterium YIM PH 21723]|nr:sensor histidine kinase [Pseudonocardiaceae bacterium YIM PH 21723]
MRLRLAVLVTATMSLVLLAFLVPLALLLRDVAQDRAVASATAKTQYLGSVVSAGDREALRRGLQQLNSAGPAVITVFLGDGGVLGEPAERSAAVRLAETGRSVTAQADGGREILTFVGDAAGSRYVIRAFVPESALTAGLYRAWLLLAVIGLGLLALGIVVADRLAVSIVRPTRELAAVSHRLARGDLTARITPGGPPEIRDVGVAVNHLAGQVRELLAEERERIADLSHRLRTPLTALRLAAEDQAEIVAAVDDLERSVTDIIATARHRTAAAGSVPGTDATKVVADRVAFWSVLAEDTEREVTVELPEIPCPVAVSREDLAACVDALLGNVFAHTPDGVALRVRLERRAEGGGRLTVSDSGPGFAGADPARRGSSGAGSTGLGLDIVSRTAAASGGAMTLGTAPGGGAQVTVEFGLTAP